MRDFWETHHWPDGEHRAHWHLTFEGQDDVHRFVRDHRPLLDDYPQLTPVPVEWLHATLQSIGPFTPEQALALSDAAHAAVGGMPAFDVEVGPAQAIHNGLVASLYPEEALSDLYGALRDATEGVLGAGALGSRPQRPWPHMSLAYSNCRWQDEDFRRTLVKDVRPKRARMTVAQVSLVDQQQDWRSLYSWTTISTIPLGTASDLGAGDSGGGR
ncbi:2'-5' RNA ligase family protein [Streptomyces sp. NBC_01233]|uniref:2'-5' RNA ligase family protein n=1 Tax=Streptomyces sp. NBC_01233 TaxID=2903787 RepID=UPI002E1196C6|nr:2'-5' RNA ligase family protein [Streptomyces sp. NBC_01233]